MFEKDSNKTEKLAGTSIGSLSDLGMGLIDSAIAKPYNATIGLIAPKIDLANDYDHNSWAAKAGDFGGSVVDVVALSKLTGWGVGKGLGLGVEKGFLSASLAENTALASTISLGTTGALYGGVFTPGSASDRLKNATVGLATFGTLGASTAWLSKVGFLGEAGSRTLMQDVAVGGMSGLPAGIVSSEATSLVNGNGLNFDPMSVGKSALYYGAFGAAMGGVGHGLTEGQSKVQNWYNSRASQEPTETRYTGKNPFARAAFGSGVKDGVEPARAPNDTAATAESKSFNIPKRGDIALGRLFHETPAADQVRLLQEVTTARPKVPMGSWMRLIAPEDMPGFLRAADQLFPDTALKNAGYLIETRNLRPPTAKSPPVDFQAWEKALSTVNAEKLAAQKAAAGAMIGLGETDKPFKYDDVTMSVKNPDLLQDTIAKNAHTEVGTNILGFANDWATIMERKMAAGEPLTADMAWQASLDTGRNPQGFEYETARRVLIDTWKNGSQLEKTLPSNWAPGMDATTDSATPIKLTADQEAQANNIGGMMLSIAHSRADAIQMVRGMDPANVDPAVQQALLDNLVQSQTYLRQMGVDSAESAPSVVQAMKNVPVDQIPRFVHYADQFHHETFPNSVMSAMDQAVASGNVPPGTQQAWIDAISAKMSIVFPGIPESDWAITKAKK